MTTSQNSVTVYRCLGDETRLSIVRKLAREGREVNGSDIVTDCSVALKLSQPTMSHHFQKLVNAGILAERKVAVEKYYQLNTDVLTQAGIDITKL